jgi:hypothetical protein
MKSLKNIAAGAAIAGALGFAAIGVGAGVASAAPPVTGGQWAQDRGWDHGHGGPDWRGGGYGYGDGGPGYGYGGPGYGYGGYGPPCVSGPLGFLQVCA